MKIVVKNRSKAPQGVHTAHGVVWVKPGAQRDVHVDEHHLERIAKAKNLHHQVLDAEPETHDQFETMTDDDLRAHLTERDGKAPHPNAKRETLLTKAREQG